MLEFSNPLYGLFGVCCLLLWLINYFKLFKKPQFFIPKRFQKKSFKWRRAVVVIIGVIAWSLISISVMEPRAPLGYANNTIEVNDIFFVVDVSASMTAKDFKPNRLEVSKNKIREFIDLRPKDRIGIILFSQKVYTLLPLSTDLKLIKKMVKKINIDRFLGSGTNIGDALALAVARGARSLAKNKVIVLLTDGVSQWGSLTPIEAAKVARDNKMKIYAIGVGKDPNARLPGGRLIPGGSTDVGVLQKIAAITNGKWYLAKSANALKKVFAEINKIERSKIKVHGQVVYDEIYLKFLIFGVLLLMATELARRFITKEGI
ncbi:MAG: VWA domain-containing protein [Bacteriovoracaceae bacterium]|nr:VWA domain-containing protein [Bacteriovoracaceae bacterium]